jgi:exodeoxyribonuclease VIII
MKKPYTNIMLDIETLSTRADAAILSIGAVKFDPHSNQIDDNAFYVSVSVDSNTEAGRHISESTLIWWLGQPAEAQKVFTEPKVTLAVALDELREFFDHADYCVWGNGPDFDNAIVAHAFSTHGVPAPWKFWNSRCMRTMKDLPSSKHVAKVHNPNAHNALTDAMSQAQQLQNYYAAMVRKAA